MSDSIKITGKVIMINPAVQVTEKYKKQEFAVETSGQYPQQIGIQFSQAKCDKLDGIKVGDVVEVDVNIKGKEYNGKYYVNLEGWNIKVVGKATGEVYAGISNPANEVDDLPF